MISSVYYETSNNLVSIDDTTTKEIICWLYWHVDIIKSTSSIFNVTWANLDSVNIWEWGQRNPVYLASSNTLLSYNIS